jgi:CRP-like cAMP-binding protein
MNLEQRASVLSQSALFKDLPASALRALARQGVERKLAQRQILFQAQEPAQGLYVVLSGAVRAFRVNTDGREQTMHVEQPGGTLAEVAVFDGGVYPSSTMADEDSTVLFLSSTVVREFLLQHPQAALNALALLAKKLRAVAALAEQLALKDVGQRLALLLLEEAGRKAVAVSDGVSFSLPLSHGQIASRLGSVREVVTRSLQKLVQQKIIAIRGHRVSILDAAGLRRLTESTR